MRTVSWLSGGVSSFIATYLYKDKVDECIYIHINNQHEDTIRFIKDCEIHLKSKTKILQSKYKSVDSVIKTFGFINSPYGAKCTDILKKRVRKEWEKEIIEPITYIWGYDASEKHRAERLMESFPEHKHIFPLIENNLSKEDCHGILKKLNIKRPMMYDLGYRNNNCIGCVKGGMGYWNKIRKDFPEVFKQMAETERLINHSCIKGVFLDELDSNRGKFEDEVLEECGIMCLLNMED